MKTYNDEQFCLRWKTFSSSLTCQFKSFKDSEDFIDVTIACTGRLFGAHKLVLSACSPYFKKIFKSNPCQHPVLLMLDVNADLMQSLLHFIYCGEVDISPNDLSQFLKIAENLQVRGLAEKNEEPPKKKSKHEAKLNSADIISQSVNPSPQIFQQNSDKMTENVNISSNANNSNKDEASRQDITLKQCSVHLTELLQADTEYDNNEELMVVEEHENGEGILVLSPISLQSHGKEISENSKQKRNYEETINSSDDEDKLSNLEEKIDTCYETLTELITPKSKCDTSVETVEENKDVGNIGHHFSDSLQVSVCREERNEVDNGILFGPNKTCKQSFSKIPKNPESEPDKNFREKYDCLVKRQNIPTYKEAKSAEMDILNETDSDVEEQSIICETVRRKQAETRSELSQNYLLEDDIPVIITNDSDQSMNDNIKKLMMKMAEINNKLDEVLKRLKNKDHESSPTYLVETIDSTIFPLSSRESLRLFNQLCEESNYADKAISYFSQRFGTSGQLDGSKVAYKLLDDMFDSELLTSYSWTGMSKEPGVSKEAFQQFGRVLYVFQKIVHLADSRFSNTKNIEFFKEKALKHSKKRCNRKRCPGKYDSPVHTENNP